MRGRVYCAQTPQWSSFLDAVDHRVFECDALRIVIGMRIPTKPAMHSNSKPAGDSDLKPATRGVVRMGQFHDVVEGWEGQETG
jgi:hypothetical protein